MSPFTALTTALQSKDPILAADAARLLGHTANPNAIPPLLRYAKTSRHHHKAAAIHALANLLPTAPKPLQKTAQKALHTLLENPNTHDDWYWVAHRALKASIALTLLLLHDDGPAEACLHALADKSDDVFFAWLAPTILTLPDSPPAARLKARLTPDTILNTPGGAGSTRNSEPGLLLMRTQALALLPGKKSESALIALTKFHSRYVRAQAAQSLLQLNHRHQKLVEKLHAKDPTAFVKIQTARALQRPKPLLQFAQTTPDPLDRATAIEALASLNNPAHFPAIQKNLSHPHPYVRQCTLESLEKLDKQKSQPLAKKLTKDPNPRVQLQAHKTLLASVSVRPSVSL